MGCFEVSKLIFDVSFKIQVQNQDGCRRLPIYLMDMLTLDERYPHIAYAFRAGKFVIHKTDRHFSVMAFDQAHQQANAVIKGDGGAIGITEDPSALKRWMVAGPLVSHLVANYEEVSGVKVEPEKRHHEKSPT